MDSSNCHRSSYKCYPYLTKAEFSEVCHYLDRRYRRATLGPLRKEWRLHVHTALELSFEPGSGRTTFLQVTRPLDNRTAADDELAAKMGGVSLGEDQDMQLDADEMMVKMEDSDKEVVSKRSSRAHFQAGHVIYEIHFHPTYSSPCLWFTLHGLPAGESPLNIETVFRHLVPEQFKDSLRTVGPIGAISIDVGEILFCLGTNHDVYSTTLLPDSLRSSFTHVPSETPWLDLTAQSKTISWYGLVWWEGVLDFGSLNRWLLSMLAKAPGTHIVREGAIPYSLTTDEIEREALS